MPQSPSFRNILVTIAALGLWVFIFWRALGTFGPAFDDNPVSFNSDSAVPVLMSNETRALTLFNAYYYSADRWGGWPFLIARAIGRATGYFWTPDSLFALQLAWIFVGVLAFASLTGRDRIIAGAIYLIALCLHRESRFLMFELSQLYAWQTTAMLMAWYGIRRTFDAALAGSTPPAPTPTRRRTRTWTWTLLALAFAFLAIWSSVASVIFLGFLIHVEALRARMKASDGRLARHVLVPYTLGVTAIVLAAALERLLKTAYHRYSLGHYGSEFSATFHIDTGYLTTNLREHFHSLATLSWWPLYVLATLAALALIVAAIHAIATKRPDARARVSAMLADDTVTLAFGSYGLAAINFVLAVIVDHVRFNLYDTRYLTLTNIFGPISAMLTIHLALTYAARRSRLRAFVQPACVLAAVVLLLAAFPAPVRSQLYRLDKLTAQTLVAKAPGAVLMGRYWETYIFSALQRTNPMIPVPFDGQVLATPWTPSALRRTDRVVVEFGSSQDLAEPMPTLRQHGLTLRLIDAYWYRNERYRFALYAIERTPSRAQ